LVGFGRLRKGDESTQPFLEKYCGWVQTCAAPKPVRCLAVHEFVTMMSALAIQNRRALLFTRDSR